MNTDHEAPDRLVILFRYGGTHPILSGDGKRIVREPDYLNVAAKWPGRYGYE